jgi:5-methylcytosine-specific restriction endonuclease McrBC regulatory subunit McrC
MRTKDNNCGNFKVSEKKELEDLKKIAGIKIDKISPEDRGNLLIFPQSWQAGVKSKESVLFSLAGDGTLTTGNIMGFIGINETELTISSRFANDEEGGHDYFLHYMLQKVLSFNITSLDLSSGKESIQDFLPYLFPGFLREALSQGIYKQYHRREYNDANVRGAIDIARHLRVNIPFMGKIAYTTREHSTDNAVTQLIRHTIEYLSARPIGNAVLANNPDTRADISAIKSVTQNYQKNDRQKVINANRKIVNHPYFTKYRQLQQLCLQILNQEKITFSGEKDKIHGLLFDGAWLWEEYLTKIFQENNTGIKHKVTTENLFEDGQGIVPDFITKKPGTNSASFIGDAKYKPFDEREGSAARNDYFQIITYMVRYLCPHGFIFYPYAKDDKKAIFLNRVIKNDMEEKYSVSELGLAIPQQSANFETFCGQITGNETEFCAKMNMMYIKVPLNA